MVCKEKWYCISGARSISVLSHVMHNTFSRIYTVQICSELKFCAATYGPLWTLRPFEHSPLPNSSKFERKKFGPSKAWVHRQPQAMIGVYQCICISPVSAYIYQPVSIWVQNHSLKPTVETTHCMAILIQLLRLPSAEDVHLVTSLDYIRYQVPAITILLVE